MEHFVNIIAWRAFLRNDQRKRKPDVDSCELTLNVSVIPPLIKVWETLHIWIGFISDPNCLINRFDFGLRWSQFNWAFCRFCLRRVTRGSLQFGLSETLGVIA